MYFSDKNVCHSRTYCTCITWKAADLMLVWYYHHSSIRTTSTLIPNFKMYWYQGELNFTVNCPIFRVLLLTSSLAHRWTNILILLILHGNPLTIRNFCPKPFVAMCVAEPRNPSIPKVKMKCAQSNSLGGLENSRHFQKRNSIDRYFEMNLFGAQQVQTHIPST